MAYPESCCAKSFDGSAQAPREYNLCRIDGSSYELTIVKRQNESMDVGVASSQQGLPRSDRPSPSQLRTAVSSSTSDGVYYRQHPVDETTPSISENAQRMARTTSEMLASLQVTHNYQPASLDNRRLSIPARAENIHQLVSWFQEAYHDLNVQQMEERSVWECEGEGWTGPSFHADMSLVEHDVARHGSASTSGLDNI